jgi:DNA invertase Pin-like site-specific DNA recombinase
MKKRVIIYARVSTKEQNVDMQLLDLTQYAEARGFEIVKKYVDIGSGAKDDRINYQKMLDDVRKRKTDIVLVWKIDRFGRSTKELVNALEEFNRLGVDFISFKESLDTNSPAGKVLFTIISSFAEFERSIIRERVKAGMEKAKARGVKIGRPGVSVEGANLIREMHREGVSKKDILLRTGISKSKYYQILSSERVI